MAETEFLISVISEKGTIFSGKAKTLFVPTLQGDTAILKSHTPTIMKLIAGQVAIRLGHANTKVCDIKEGLMHVEENNAVVLVVEDK